MKKIKTFLVASLAILAVIATSCGSGDDKKAAPAAKAKTTKTDVHILPNYRYVDLDSFQRGDASHAE